MFESLKGRARRFLTAPSGTRFRAYHARLAQRPSLMRTLLAIGCGLILLALGLVMVVLPGPGLLVAAIGAVLIAGESMWAAPSAKSPMISCGSLPGVFRRRTF